MRFCLLFLSPLFILFSCGTKHPAHTTAQQDTLYLPAQTKWQVNDVLATATFVNTDAHQLSGKAFIYHAENDDLILSIENLSVLGGPDVDVFLSDSSGYANVIRLGHLEGNDGQPVKGQLAYVLGHNIDLKKYNYVIIWCKQYSVLFGYARLTFKPGFSGKLE